MLEYATGICHTAVASTTESYLCANSTAHRRASFEFSDPSTPTTTVCVAMPRSPLPVHQGHHRRLNPSRAALRSTCHQHATWWRHPQRCETRWVRVSGTRTGSPHPLALTIADSYRVTSVLSNHSSRKSAKGQPRQHGGLVESSMAPKPVRNRQTHVSQPRRPPPHKLRDGSASRLSMRGPPEQTVQGRHHSHRCGIPIPMSCNLTGESAHLSSAVRHVSCETRWSTCDAHTPGDLRLRRRYSADRSAGHQHGRSRQRDTSSCSVLVRGDADAQLTAGNVHAPLQGRSWAGPVVGGNGCSAGSCPA